MTAELVDEDPYLWLEDIDAERALFWVHERNAETTASLTTSPANRPGVIAAVGTARDGAHPTVGYRGDLWLP